MQPIPCHIVSGFLGSGKTTLIRHLIRHKPHDERWAVLVNEFGEAGIDQAMLPESDDLVVRTLPGGCLCCQLAVTLKATLVQLIRRHRPERLLIEPSGLGHPAGLVEVLQDEDLAPVIDLRPMIAMLDPRKLDDARYTGHQTFRDQLAMADAVVISKPDLATAAQIDKAEQWVATRWPPLQWVEKVCQGELSIGRLLASSSRVREAHARASDHPLPSDGGNDQVTLELDMAVTPGEGEVAVQQRSALGYRTLSLRWHPRQCFVLGQLLARLEELPGEYRIKAVIHAGEGWRIVNNADDSLHCDTTAWRRDSRLEIIWPEHSTLDTEELVVKCQACRVEND
ncbi:CobW family GTP-binding protein [Halomonas huangheensis]|uniref:CobW/HypB/UreG nucleotide-binding domain-containing protein n=1 Tax=Halomonas huangheensis TaxID=1178482 RepID=W1NBS9_9GAMM|nr:GTP-binding protein [Halomonas huangheensis]ALM52485.1 hypothetical protein AR456_09500 [Halomonas huangheensis]ERL53017.1 hypothetical protein BJB45_17205 [Halomonas huangheensis]